MNWIYEAAHENSLRPARGEEEYLLHQAALEWSLADPIIIQSAEDILSTAHWRDRLKPFHHQVQNLFTFCRRLPVTLLADDVGLGKTISAGLILSELMARRRVSRALVLCPKILFPQWVRELKEKFGIEGRTAVGQSWADELARKAPVIVTTYETASSRLADIAPGAFDMLILDEAHRLRNLHPGPKPPKMATAVRSALEKRLFKYVVLLTATPIHNCLWDLYSLIDCLTVAKGHKNPLGTPQEFKERYLLPDHDGRRLNPCQEEGFRSILRQYLARTRREDAKLVFPTRDVCLLPVDLSAQEKSLSQLVSRHIGGLNRLQQISLAQALMSSPAALTAQLKNMAEKQPSLLAVAREAQALADASGEPAKLQRLLSICEKLKDKRSDWRIVVFTLRKETQNLIGNALKAKGIAVGYIRGGQPKENEQSIARFWDHPPQVNALISTDAGAEGVNLQAANVLVNYDLPWNPMVVEQRIGRLQRLKSEHEYVLVNNLVAADSVEQHVVGRLMAKLQCITQAIGDIKSILVSPQWEGDKRSFKEQIRDLVVKSLLGQDVNKATQLREESIERAWKQIEDQRPVLDQALGKRDELHRTGPRMPKLSRVEPRMTVEEFVLRAWRADGWTVVERRPGAYDATAPGRPREVIAFDEKAAEACSSQAVFMGKVKLYQPGKTEFERLVQHWVDRGGHHVYNLRRRAAADAERLARSWCQTIPEAAFLGCDVTKYEPQFQGRATIRVKASNGVDGYEKLIVREFHPDGHPKVRPTDNPSDLLREEIRPGDVLPDLSAAISRVEADPDVAEFRRFYEARRIEELTKAGDDPRLRHKIHEDFTPSIVAEIAGFQGVRYDKVLLKVRFSLRGEGNYEIAFGAIPASGQVLDEPPRKLCEHSGLRVPAGCLESCQRTGKHVLKHLLFASEDSGRRGLRDRMVTCQVTKKKVLDDEVETSAVSGVVALKGLFVPCEQTDYRILRSEAGQSAVSGKVVWAGFLRPSDKPPHRLGLEEEFGTCEVTSQRLLSDELGRSDVSGRLVSLDLLHRSAATGALALAEEMVVCMASGREFLREETGRCEITDKTVDKRLLSASEVSGTTGRTDLMERCAVTKKLVLPRELATCEVTGLPVLPCELGECFLTHKRVMPSRLVLCEKGLCLILDTESGRSAVSGVRVWKGLLKASDKPPRRLGLEEEFGICESTGKRLLVDERGRCVVSERLVDWDRLHRSARSGLPALLEEMAICQVSGKEFLPWETGRCALTGQTVDERLLSTSEVSGAMALTDLMQRCAVTHKLVLPGELEPCQITGLRVLPGELGECSLTHNRVLPSRLGFCQKSGRRILATELGRSAVSGKAVWAGFLIPSDKPPHRLGLEEELGTCEATSQRLLSDELGRSDVSGKLASLDLLHRSAASGALALAEEMVVCMASGREFLREETGLCEITGKTVDKRLLSASDVSGATGLTDLMQRCAVTKKLVLPRELVVCEATRLRVLPDELETCAVTGARGIRCKMLRSDVSGKYVVPKAAVHSAVGNKIGLPKECVKCAWLERPILRVEAKACALTGLLVAKSLLTTDDQLWPLVALLDGRSQDVMHANDLIIDANNLIPQIRSLDEPFFRGLTRVRAIRSRGRGKLAVCGEIRSWFGAKVRYVGFLLRTEGEFRIIGRGVLGYRAVNEWVLESELDFS